LRDLSRVEMYLSKRVDVVVYFLVKLTIFIVALEKLRGSLGWISCRLYIASFLKKLTERFGKKLNTRFCAEQSICVDAASAMFISFFAKS
jgi:hypothetical protein